MKKKPPASPEPDDLDLFRAQVGDAIPLRAAERYVPKAQISPTPVQSLLDAHATLDESLSGDFGDYEISEDENFLRPGIGPDVLRKLKRGHWRVQYEIDLHGMTRVEAHTQLSAFLRECVKRGARCIRIVHGKGLGSKNREPVLKGKVRAWLTRRDEILAYCEAPPVQGGSGALLVLLK
ncbi:MAG TPA: Smr/MutS family protein [Burkholderiales bacterium]|nr:Smr/MutS family protein [Burkholderiales bacterium]